MLGECFDPTGELLISEHCRPHWSQAGAVVFITFRSYDSIPARSSIAGSGKNRSGCGSAVGETKAHWSAIIETLPEKVRAVFQKTFDRCRESFLDTCHGRCLLRQPELAQIVADSILHFDGQRYRMGDFIVMSNHVNLLAVFSTAEAMKGQSLRGFVIRPFGSIRRSTKKANSGSKSHSTTSYGIRTSMSI